MKGHTTAMESYSCIWYHKPNSFATPAPSAPTAAPVITTGAATAPNTTAPMVAADLDQVIVCITSRLQRESE